MKGNGNGARGEGACGMGENMEGRSFRRAKVEGDRERGLHRVTFRFPRKMVDEK